MASKTAVDTTTWGEEAPERVTEIPSHIEASLEAVDSGGKRQAYAWSIDAYDTVLVRAYGPMGESLPDGGLTLTRSQFVKKSLDRAGRVAGTYNEFGPLDEWFVRIDVPASARIESVTITLA